MWFPQLILYMDNFRLFEVNDITKFEDIYCCSFGQIFKWQWFYSVCFNVDNFCQVDLKSVRLRCVFTPRPTSLSNIIWKDVYFDGIENDIITISWLSTQISE